MKSFIFFVLFFISTFSCADVPRGLRNNNPGNIRGTEYSFRLWPKAKGVDDEFYLVFERPIDGIRAIVINLRAYRHNHNVKTVRQIITRWTYREGNSPVRKDYIKVVCERVGVSQDQVINFDNALVLEKLTRSIIYFENGVDPYHEKIYSRIFPRNH
jgi:hypothetical protein